MGWFGLGKRMQRARPSWWKVCLVKNGGPGNVSAIMVDTLAYTDTQAIEYTEAYFGNGRFATVCNYCGDWDMYQQAIVTGDARPLPAYDEEGNRLPWRHNRTMLQSEGHTRIGP